MEIRFENGQWITPEDMLQRARENYNNLVDTKRCIICRNTYLINDEITMCHLTNECVDNHAAGDCNMWDPLPFG